MILLNDSSVVFQHNTSPRVYNFQQRCVPIVQSDYGACRDSRQHEKLPTLFDKHNQNLIQQNRILINYKKLTHLEAAFSKNTSFLKKNFDFLLSQLKTTVSTTSANNSGKFKASNKIVDAFNAKYEKPSSIYNNKPQLVDTPPPKTRELSISSTSTVACQPTVEPAVSFVKRRETLYSNNSSASYFKLAKAALSQKNKHLFNAFDDLDYEFICNNHHQSSPNKSFTKSYSTRSRGYKNNKKDRPTSNCVQQSIRKSPIRRLAADLRQTVSICKATPTMNTSTKRQQHAPSTSTSPLARLRAKYPDIFVKNVLFREQIDFSKSMIQFTLCLHKILTRVEKVNKILMLKHWRSISNTLNSWEIDRGQ